MRVSKTGGKFPSRSVTIGTKVDLHIISLPPLHFHFPDEQSAPADPNLSFSHSKQPLLRLTTGEADTPQLFVYPNMRENRTQNIKKTLEGTTGTWLHMNAAIQNNSSDFHVCLPSIQFPGNLCPFLPDNLGGLQVATIISSVLHCCQNPSRRLDSLWVTPTKSDNWDDHGNRGGIDIQQIA